MSDEEESSGTPPSDPRATTPVGAQWDPDPYVAAVLAWAADDEKHVYIRVTAAIGVAVLYLTQLPFERLANLSGWPPWRGALVAGLGLVLLAAGLYFKYQTSVHTARAEVAGKLYDGQGDPAGSNSTTRLGRLAT